MPDTQLSSLPGQVVLSGGGSVVMVTIREHIIAAFQTAMAVINVANGYHSDAGNNVIRCRKSLDPAELPCVVLWPGLEIPESREYGSQNCSMKLGIEGHALFGAENMSVVSERILGDLYRALFSQEIISYADEILYESGGTDSYPDTGDVAIGVKITLNIKYNYLIGNPYSQ